MWSDFKAFLLKQNVLALAIAFIVGAALNTLVKALVDDFIMPLVTLVSPSMNWKEAKWQIGALVLAPGDFGAALLNFIIIGFVAWRLSKLVPSPAAPPAMKACSFCFAMVDARATRCPQCTSAL